MHDLCTRAAWATWAPRCAALCSIVLTCTAVPQHPAQLHAGGLGNVGTALRRAMLDCAHLRRCSPTPCPTAGGRPGRCGHRAGPRCAGGGSRGGGGAAQVRLHQLQPGAGGQQLPVLLCVLWCVLCCCPSTTASAVTSCRSPASRTAVACAAVRAVAACMCAAPRMAEGLPGPAPDFVLSCLPHHPRTCAWPRTFG